MNDGRWRWFPVCRTAREISVSAGRSGPDVLPFFCGYKGDGPWARLAAVLKGPLTVTSTGSGNPLAGLSFTDFAAETSCLQQSTSSNRGRIWQLVVLH